MQRQKPNKDFFFGGWVKSCMQYAIKIYINFVISMNNLGLCIGARLSFVVSLRRNTNLDYVI